MACASTASLYRAEEKNTPLGGDVIVSVDVDELDDIYLGADELLRKYVCPTSDVPLDILNYLDHVEYILRKYVK